MRINGYSRVGPGWYGAAERVVKRRRAHPRRLSARRAPVDLVVRPAARPRRRAGTRGPRPGWRPGNRGCPWSWQVGPGASAGGTRRAAAALGPRSPETWPARRPRGVPAMDARLTPNVPARWWRRSCTDLDDRERRPPRGRRISRGDDFLDRDPRSSAVRRASAVDGPRLHRLASSRRRRAKDSGGLKVFPCCHPA